MGFGVKSVQSPTTAPLTTIPYAVPGPLLPKSRSKVITSGGFKVTSEGDTLINICGSGTGLTTIMTFAEEHDELGSQTS